MQDNCLDYIQRNSAEDISSLYTHERRCDNLFRRKRKEPAPLTRRPFTSIWTYIYTHTQRRVQQQQQRQRIIAFLSFSSLVSQAPKREGEIWYTPLYTRCIRAVPASQVRTATARASFSSPFKGASVCISCVHFDRAASSRVYEGAYIVRSLSRLVRANTDKIISSIASRERCVPAESPFHAVYIVYIRFRN